MAARNSRIKSNTEDRLRETAKHDVGSIDCLGDHGIDKFAISSIVIDEVSTVLEEKHGKVSVDFAKDVILSELDSNLREIGRVPPAIAFGICAGDKSKEHTIACVFFLSKIDRHGLRIALICSVHDFLYVSRGFWSDDFSIGCSECDCHDE